MRWAMRYWRSSRTLASGILVDQSLEQRPAEHLVGLLGADDRGQLLVVANKDEAVGPRRRGEGARFRQLTGRPRRRRRCRRPESA